MAEENDKTGRDEALNEDASTPETADDATDETPVAEAPAKAGKFDRLTQEEGGVRKLTGMYKNWFLDYASYVILERAVPHVEDGLKPVQRRILHAMKVVDDGRYNKVANLVGQTMQYHPHGDASIKDALVQLGQNAQVVCVFHEAAAHEKLQGHIVHALFLALLGLLLGVHAAHGHNVPQGQGAGLHDLPVGGLLFGAAVVQAQLLLNCLLQGILGIIRHLVVPP